MIGMTAVTALLEPTCEILVRRVQVFTVARRICRARLRRRV